MVSSKARNQRKMRANAPAHIKRKMLSSHLSADLQKEYGKRSARVCLGDTVMVLRGGEDIRGVEGKVIGVMTDEGRITIEGVTINQADNTAVARPIHASNVVITKLNLDDAWRKDALKRGKGAKE
ncbi:MAG: 50S ribosomal protein L24 [Methanomassiliicoccales archaeon]|uniref:50S ribosomal protein L24 n=1 Tax=Candidatus Methanarcanum hacksteinii TaxID=2911857 RepID=UPI002A7AF5E1|nr:50S ribosomal protein L24 [Candidatus Methanomethylophilaceae archaeon]MCI6024598.1 50S ribosomal protein L24 [Methanomassiliicoccales archaeon]MDD7478893.1 50S ribosomal protein L24 [Methanomassiliicoccales archaeon]MDY4580238.1 50S ribosomal protein L24 [Candidatus Methanarcanum hacksteinii]TQS76930.1 MAG: 50S ribosomal protein L24 [Candidatus Methanarcanum hacksteinii]